MKKKLETNEDIQSKKTIKLACILNLILFILELFAIIWMASGIHIFSESKLFMASRLEMFKYYTIDSNILVGISSLLLAIQEIKALKNNKQIGLIYYIFKLISTTSVTITMLVTVLFLVPKEGLIVLYNESNLLLHLINPLLSIIIFICFEKNSNIKFRKNIYSLIPIVTYMLYYIGTILLHMKKGVIETGYDWYGFFMIGNSSFPIIPLILIIFTLLISIILWKLNKKIYIHEEKII